MNAYKKKLISEGKYTICPIALKGTLTPTENAILDTLIYFDDNNQAHISISLVEIYTCLTQKTVQKVQTNLEKLGFISLGKKSRKGTRFSVNWDGIYTFALLINGINNPIKQLIAKDNYRVEHGLSSIANKTVNRYAGSPFDDDMTRSTNVAIEPEKEAEKSLKKTVKNRQKSDTNNNNSQRESILLELNKLQEEYLTVKTYSSQWNDLNNHVNDAKARAKRYNIRVINNNGIWTAKD